MSSYVNLAKKAIINLLENSQKIEISAEDSSIYHLPAKGVFVTLYNQDQLRGCIGTILPTKKYLGEEIITNAIAAAQDSRFEPVSILELPKLAITVSILDEPESVTDIKELDPHKYGIIVKSVSENNIVKSAVLLPNILGINTAEQQLDAVCQKGTINPNREIITIFKFSVVEYK